MIRAVILAILKPTRSNILLVRLESTSKLNIDTLEKDLSPIDVVEEEVLSREREIEIRRDKSRLKVQDRNFLHEENPYPEPQQWYHGTLKYNRRLYGRYGAASRVNPAICWPTKQELDQAVEYENVAYPFTIPQMIENVRIKRIEEREANLKRQQDIVKKMEKLDTWKQDLRDKIAKKEGEIRAAKERREKLIEEVRRHFGYTVDPKDDRFKEMLEKKEKEQKKAMKEAKRKAKEEKMMVKLLTKQPDEKNKNKNNEDTNVDKDS